MRRISVLLALLAAISLTFFADGAQAADRYGKQKAVYDVHFDGGEGDKDYMRALRNVQNHVNAVGNGNIEVKVVLAGNGIGMLKNANTNLKLQGVITNLKTQNVAFLVCNNTLVGRKIDPNSLFEVFKEDIVPSGNAEIAHLQGQGFTYIRP